MHGACVDGVGEYTCDCQPGFDGIHCEIGELCLALFSQHFVEWSWIIIKGVYLYVEKSNLAYNDNEL